MPRSNTVRATLYAVGRILKSVGLKGWVKIMPMTHSLNRFHNLNEVFIGLNEHTAVHRRIEAVTYSRGTIKVKLKNIDTRSDSDNVVNHYLFVDEEHLVLPPVGSFFIHDIIGCTILANQEIVGTVIDVYTRERGLAQDIWVVESDGKVLWIPAVKDFIEKVDVHRRRIVVRRVGELPS